MLGVAPGTSAGEAEDAYRHRLLSCHPDLHAAEGPEAVARAEAETRELNQAIDLIRRGYRPQARARATTGHGSPGGFGFDRGPRPRSGRPGRPGGFGGSGGYGGYGGFGSAGAEAKGGFDGGSPYGSAWWSTGAGGRPEDPWSDSGSPDAHQSGQPVPCPYCHAPVTTLDEFAEHLVVRHPGVAGIRVRRSSGAEPTRTRHRSWWPMPIGLVALVNLAVVLSVIAVVAVFGGHYTLMHAIAGDAAPRACQPGTIVSGVFGPHECNPNDWVWTYLLLGMAFTPYIAIWRWTTRPRD